MPTPARNGSTLLPFRFSASFRFSIIRACAAIVESDDVAGWQDSNLGFHELIYRATRNPYLRQEVLRIRTRTGYYRKHAFGALGRIRASYEQHGEVVNALQKGDAAAAAVAMVAHMRPEQSPSGMTDVIVNLPKTVFAED